MFKLVLAVALLSLALAWQPSPLSFKRFEEEADAGVHFKRPPSYSSYILSGYIELPYAEIKEQFTVYFDSKTNNSRIDYYDGLVKTIQRGDAQNVMYKIAYTSTETTLNKLTCFHTPGSAESPVRPQGGVPSLDEFSFIGTTKYNGRTADQWRFTEIIGSKKNVYTFIVDTQTGHPYRYEMAGYDSLFGSHFDKYYIEYNYFSDATPDADVFQPPSDLDCQGWQPGTAENHVLMNPLSEYVSRNVKHHDEMFDAFKQTHNKNYVTEKEHAARHSVFLQNVRFIHSHNRAAKPYRVAINHLADRTDEELRALRGFRRTTKNSNAELYNPLLHNAQGVEAQPDNWDWRLYGAVTPVKDQAVCGSCWSFGTTGCVEGAHFMKTGNLVRLSQQELVDCSWGEGNYGCDGGEDFQAYEFIKKHGLSTEDYYGAYMAQDGICKVNNVTSVAHITGYVSIPSGDQDALRQAMIAHGPISVAIDASHKSLSFYANGVYYEPQCGNTIDSLDHAVLAVGYGKLRDGSSYWLVKNSWSTYWGKFI